MLKDRKIKKCIALEKYQTNDIRIWKERINVNSESILLVLGSRIHLTFECSEEYKKKVRDIFENFQQNDDFHYENDTYIYMNQEKIEVQLNNTRKTFSGYLKTDIYPIMYSIVYELARSNGGVGVHSVAVEKKNKVILIFGDYGVGKSTLALSFEKMGWNIISTDQTIIKKKSNQLQIISGSKYMKYKDKCLYYKGVSQRENRINMIVGIKGLANNGEVNVFHNTRSISRVLWDHCVWPWNTLICGYSMINDFKKNENMEAIKKVLSDVNTPLYYVRGDSDGVRDMLIELNDRIIKS